MELIPPDYQVCFFATISDSYALNPLLTVHY